MLINAFYAQSQAMARRRPQPGWRPGEGFRVLMIRGECFCGSALLLVR